MPEENKQGSGDAPLKEAVIPREDAVFWLDGRGYWRNSGGRFRKKKINDYFHAAIDRDAGGYFISQVKGDVLEKVYFPYEDTALFVFGVRFAEDAIELVLNTGRRMVLDPGGLYIQGDCLYLDQDNERIKFSERAMMQLSPLLEEALEEDGEALYVCFKGARHRIPEFAGGHLPG